MTHPSLGLPPRDMTAGSPVAAQTIRARRTDLAARSLEVAIEIDPTLRARNDDIALRRLLHDAQVMSDRIADAVASGDPRAVSSWADQVVPLYRRRQVPMDDLVRLMEGLRRALAGILSPSDLPATEAAIDEGVRIFHWHRRLAGDARRRNRIVTAIYRGG